MASSKTDIAEAATNQSIAHAEEDKDQFKIAELEKELQALVFLILSLTSHVPNFLPIFVSFYEDNTRNCFVISNASRAFDLNPMHHGRILNVN